MFEPEPSNVPAAWACEPLEYNDGLVCQCECGVPDPDCAAASIPVVDGCLLGDVCSPQGTCTSCGNGVVDDDEACDAAASATAECSTLGYAPGQVGCSATCEWAYDGCVPLATCGNGMLDDGELCEAANIKAGLTCMAFGRTQGSLACGAGCAINKSACHTCGDGKLEANEACDDGDATGSDGCSAACDVETGWSCSGTPSVCGPKCGDGKIIGGEQCDDGDATGNDGCSGACKIETDCQCIGTPSVCTCTSVQTIVTLPKWIDVGSLVLDANGQAKAIYAWDVDFTDSATGWAAKHVYLRYAERGAASWTTSEIATWDQPSNSLDDRNYGLLDDGGTLRTFFHRLHNTAGSFAVGARSSGTWQLGYGPAYLMRSVVRGAGNWHALVDGSSFGDLRYRMGSPGAWTRDEALTGFSVNEELRLAHTTNGDIYLATFTRGASNASYRTRLSKRVDATTWTSVYDITTNAPAAGSCVYPIKHEPIALPSGGLVAFEDGFDKNGKRWLRAHRQSGATWVVDSVADLSGLSVSCSSGGASWRTIPMVFTVDALGRPHIMYPRQDSKAFVAHYLDATGWKTRSFPITNAAPLDLKIDANGTAHVLAVAPGTNNVPKLVYVRVGPTAWM